MAQAEVMDQVDVPADAQAAPDQVLDDPIDQPLDDPNAQTPPADGEEVVITIGDESPPSEEEERDSKAPPWVGELRKSKRETDRLNRELKAEVERLKGAGQQPQAVAVGPKPTLEACEYDEGRFETEFTAWQARKAAVQHESEAKQKAAEEATKAWNAQLAHHGKLKSALKVPDFDDAEAEVETALSTTQQGLIVHGAENSAQVIYALGKNPKTLKDLAAITDPVKFAFAVAKLETKLKVTPRSTAPIPERVVRGNAPAPGNSDKKLDQLEAQAARTGDRTAVIAYKRSLKSKPGR